jgi:zinc protease
MRLDGSGVARRLFLVLALASSAAALPLAAAPGVPETTVLPNGLRAVLLEDHALPIVSVSLWVGAGSRTEIESSAGYTHFLEHLIQRGTDASGPFEFTRRAQRWGGSLSVRSNYDRTYITVNGVPSALDGMIDATAAMALRAALKDGEIDQELGTFTQEIRTYYDRPSSVAFLETMRAAFPDHPYRWPMLGNFHTVGTLRGEPLQAFYKNMYVPNNMALAVVGDFDPKTTMSRIEAAFGAASKSATLPTPPPPPATFAGHNDIEKRLEFGESWTTLSFAGPGYRHPDRLAFEVLTAALAESSAPPTQEVLRSKTGMVSQISYYGLDSAGILYVALNPITPETSYDVAAAAMKGIVAFKKAGVSQAALNDLVTRLLRDERLRAATVTERSERLGEAALFGGVRYYWDRARRLAALTPADLARVAARYLVPANMRLVVLVPKATGNLAEPPKLGFHQAADGLGSPDLAPAGGANPPSGFEAELYTPADATRADPAAWGAAGGAALGEPQRTTLKNGVTIVALADHRQPLVGLSLHLRAGSGLDPAGREGIAGLALRMLGARAVAILREQAAGSSRRPPVPELQVNRDVSEIRMTGTPADLGPALDALARALDQPLPGSSDLEAARQAALASLARVDMDPDAPLTDLFHEKAYPGHPYAHRPAGSSAGIAAITAADLTAFAAKALGPERTVVAITGDVDPAEVLKLAGKAFGGRKRSASGDAPPAGARANEAAAAGDFSRQSTAPQARILMGVPTVPLRDPDFLDLRTLGAGITLIGFEDMVFARRAAFSIVSVPEGLDTGGTLSFQVMAPPGHASTDLFDLKRLLSRMASTPMQAADLQDVGRMLAGREAGADEGVTPLASALAYREAAGLGAAAWRDAFRATTPDPERLRALAEKYLRADRWITIITTPTP